MSRKKIMLLRFVVPIVCIAILLSLSGCSDEDDCIENIDKSICEIDESLIEPIGAVSLSRWDISGSHLFEIFDDGRVVKTQAGTLGFQRDTNTFNPSRLDARVEFFLTQYQLEALLSDIDNFINEDMSEIYHFHISADFQVNFNIRAIHNELNRFESGSIVVPVPDTLGWIRLEGDWTHTPMAEILIAHLKEITPIPIRPLWRPGD